MPKHLGPGKNDEWRTPPSLIDGIGITYDLDPCAPLDGPYFVPARHRFTSSDDGLIKPWFGRTFVNPPFGGRRGHVPWLKKFFAHGDGIALVNALTSSDWFHNVLVPKVAAANGVICFPRGKTKFYRPDGTLGKEPANGVALIAVGEIACKALLQSRLGVCMSVMRVS
jgi:hypothetical protein